MIVRLPLFCHRPLSLPLLALLVFSSGLAQEILRDSFGIAATATATATIPSGIDRFYLEANWIP